MFSNISRMTDALEGSISEGYYSTLPMTRADFSATRILKNMEQMSNIKQQ